MSHDEHKQEIYFDEEEVDENIYRVKFSVPAKLKPEHIKIKYKKNGFFVEYIDEVGKERDGWTYHRTDKGYYSRTFPFEIKDPKAKLEDENVVFTFERGENISSEHHTLTLGGED